MDAPSGATLLKKSELDQLPFLFSIYALNSNFRHDFIQLQVDNEARFRTPESTWVQFQYLFESNIELRQQYTKLNTTHIRVGKMMEEMDALAASVSYRFIRDIPESKDVTFVTAAVDFMDFFSGIGLENDLRVSAYVIHSGRSTLTVQIDFHVKDNMALDQWTMVGFAIMIMAARKDNSSYMLPKLDISSGNDSLAAMRFKLGAENKQASLLEKKLSPLRVPPTEDESRVMHSLFRSSLKKSSMVPIESTVVTATMVMHQQDRNIHGKVFGGLLMRNAFELAYIAVRQFSEAEDPSFVSCDQINFIKAIEIGSIVKLSATVVYTQDRLVRVRVEASDLTSQLQNQEEEPLTNEFHFIFEVDKEVPEVMPRKYHEGMLYLEGKRRTER